MYIKIKDRFRLLLNIEKRELTVNKKGYYKEIWEYFLSLLANL